jgi:hypothetical protein
MRFIELTAIVDKDQVKFELNAEHIVTMKRTTDTQITILTFSNTPTGYSSGVIETPEEIKSLIKKAKEV